jgi:hypothetical protein
MVVWVHVIYELHDRIEKPNFFRKTTPISSRRLDDDRPAREDVCVIRGADRPEQRGGIATVRPTPFLVAA